MPTLPRIHHRSAKARALRAWHGRLNVAVLGLTLATLPKFPLIEGQGRPAARFAPRPVPVGAA